MFFMQRSLFWNKSSVVSGNTYPKNCHFRTLKFRPTTMYRYWQTFYRALWIAVSFVRKSRMRSRVFIRLNVFPSPGRKLLINVNRLRWIIFTKPAFQISFFRNTESRLACCVLTRHDHPAKLPYTQGFDLSHFMKAKMAQVVSVKYCDIWCFHKTLIFPYLNIPDFLRADL